MTLLHKEFLAEQMQDAKFAAEIEFLRRVASALGARLEINLRPAEEV